MCHFEVKNVPTLVRGPNSGALHHTTRFQPQKAGFLGRILPKLARIGRARVRTPLLAWRTLPAYRLTIGPPRYIKRAPTMCHFEVQNVPTLVRGPNSGAFHHTTRFQPQKAGFLGRILPKLARIGRARQGTPLLAWRTLRAYRWTLGPPRYIKKAPTMCHITVRNVPTLVRGPNSGAIHYTTRFQPQKAGFLGRILPKLARIGRARVRTPLLAWRTLHAYRLSLGPPRYIKRAFTMCHFEVKNVPTLVSGPQLWGLPSYHPLPISISSIFRQNFTKTG